MRIIQAGEWQLFRRRKSNLAEAFEKVLPIIREVRDFGDEALRKFAREFDKRELADIRVKKRGEIAEHVRAALLLAKENITKFHEKQRALEWWMEIAPGIRAGQLVRPIEKVGCYVPGGRYPLLSTVLMTVIPAKVAGVKKVYVCTPNPSPEIVEACDLVGVDAIFEVGGAGAIAAFAYGTETVPKVDKIVGPGNIYVTAAKKAVYGDVGIDFLAGPSEIVILADEGSNPTFIAADLLAQAEHDVAAIAVLITPSKELAEQVQEEIKKMLPTLSTRETATLSLEQNGAIILVDTMEEAMQVANRIAPEHIEIHSEDPKLLSLVENAGSIFMGAYAAVAAGDYATGTNHALPTAGFTAVQSGLSVRDFIKTPTVQCLSKEGLRLLAPAIIALAEAEGLEGHANSIKVRIK